MDAIIGATLETARVKFLNTHESFYKLASGGDRTLLESWLDNSREDPIKNAVGYATSIHGVDDPDITQMLEASMRFRVLAGILTRPIEYDTENILEGGICANLKYDKESGGWKCKVPGNQRQADAWHRKFGHSAACPFHKKSDRMDPMEKSETEIERMIFDEGMDLDEAHRHLGLR